MMCLRFVFKINALFPILLIEEGKIVVSMLFIDNTKVSYLLLC